MKKRLVILFLLAGLAGGVACHAQNATVNYSYDASGNRIQRTLAFKKAEDNDKGVAATDSAGWLAEASGSIAGVRLSLYPNPTAGQFTLAFTEALPSPVQVCLCTSSGAVIETRAVRGTSEVFDLTGKSAGVYLLLLEAGGKAQTWKIIKKN